MAEDLEIISGTPEEKYENILPQIEALISGESNLIANMANVAAALKEQFNWLWTGFYLVENDELVLGPFQGPPACTRIRKGRGVCGEAWEKMATVMVGDVLEHRDHIACSSMSRSEIVVPIIKNGNLIAVLDADSEHVDHFTETDQQNLETIARWLAGE